jgi:hypothetical protein
MKKKRAKTKRSHEEPQESAPARSDGDTPHWDRQRRELWLGQTLVKRFRRPAPMAMRILDAFAESQWAHRIDDPLTPNRRGQQRERLRHEIQALNRRLDNPLIRFSMDGTGQGIIWDFA